MEATAAENCSVKVAVHVRPLIGDERLQGCADCVTVVPGKPQVARTHSQCECGGFLMRNNCAVLSVFCSELSFRIAIDGYRDEFLEI